jgi:hypothetical protein
MPCCEIWAKKNRKQLKRNRKNEKGQPEKYEK